MFRKKSLSFTVLTLAVLPVMLLGIATTVFAGYYTNHIMVEDIEKNLAHMTYTICMQFDSINAEKYTLENNVLKKGSVILNEDFSKIDELKEKTGADITVFYGEVRILTTIKEKNGRRVINTTAPKEVRQKVLYQGEEYFADNILVQGVPYFGYYIPLREADGNIVGMVFAGEPRKEARSIVLGYIVKLALVILLFVLLMVFAAFLASRSMLTSLQDVKTFLGKVAKGDLEAVPSEKLIQRNDEIGELGSYVIKVRDSLKDMIEKDPLTLLYNRRYCDRQLKRMESCEEDNYTAVIADVDFFKKINDRYGHGCGDYVLKELSAEMEQLVRGKGFAVRWGGEEFLMIFRNMTKQQAYKELIGFLQKIREKEFCYEGEHFSITMTFGVQQGNKTEKAEDVIRRADEKLYEGKQSGRNTIVA